MKAMRALATAVLMGLVWVPAWSANDTLIKLLEVLYQDGTISEQAYEMLRAAAVAEQQGEGSALEVRRHVHDRDVGEQPAGRHHHRQAEPCSDARAAGRRGGQHERRGTHQGVDGPSQDHRHQEGDHHCQSRPQRDLRAERIDP